ncbi:protein YgfX [Pseudomonadota bacterium]
MTSSAKFAVPFRIALQTSFLLNGALAVIYFGVFYWLWLYEIPLLLRLAVFAAVVTALVIHLRRYLFRTCKRAVKGLVWKTGGEWLLETNSGETVAAKLLGSSFVSPWLIVLNFKPEQGGRMWPVVIMQDHVDSTSFRRLSAKLRMYGSEALNKAG